MSNHKQIVFLATAIAYPFPPQANTSPISDARDDAVSPNDAQPWNARGRQDVPPNGPEGLCGVEAYSIAQASARFIVDHNKIYTLKWQYIYYIRSVKAFRFVKFAIRRYTLRTIHINHIMIFIIHSKKNPLSTMGIKHKYTCFFRK
ncbi:hypothetical protein CHELA41_21765 [Hyphomicrobiales bacterium]|nr:hypothetical protein CHELA41_21765 [Hyphomicrobiales bacterium]